jgi:hypothetical protein
MKYENQHFEFAHPIFSQARVDGKIMPILIGEWIIEGIANIDNANNHEFEWHLISMSFKKNQFENRHIQYEDFYLDEETLSDIISQHLYGNFQTRLSN